MNQLFVLVLCPTVLAYHGQRGLVVRRASTQDAHSLLWKDIKDSPFAAVSEDIELVVSRTRNLVDKTLGIESRPLIKDFASKFLEPQSFPFRPAVVVLAGRSIQTKDLPLSARQCLLAEIVEMMHVAEIIHDSILERNDDASIGNVMHHTYNLDVGNKMSVLAGDYLLARCSVALAQLGDLTVVTRMAGALESITEGNIVQGMATNDQKYHLQFYKDVQALRVCNLLSEACRSTAILAGYEQNSDLAQGLATYGFQLGLAYQMLTDTAIYHRTLQTRPDATLASVQQKTPLLPPLILAVDSAPDDFSTMLATPETTRISDVHKAILHHEVPQKLSAFINNCLQSAISGLDAVPAGSERDALREVATFFIERASSFSFLSSVEKVGEVPSSK
uniref:Uncharacterized protein n=1 Tax=Aureoumbra lagunensis TaxID=44058 RepID=A0A7S3K5G0_9STRA|mmetsp:Transcript_5979/g.8466  ORF Transcript_5979/g.8466 Transcript_5979/m.8466 type:complete len:391 (+) Transcript_5979:68-1240(+)|eukprot:CAMPEP_0197314834 /NCGR_PEP_ID=MMETSP0891-20130614/35419_1 /TAXON_ID=44058 ORGANISM="Aureoumbra lagunensis, Strain CCMP1510" /NCGR_SAMPLE_ID=MMETSP0891 /ASSEMBLY_ACC=CAM_ASM_000534 /LENGTH=390 /DNA_ID=CAMNT_0042803469 /DNA_START=29 /DNA_END=1201 /DNA_ORIENTATION=+